MATNQIFISVKNSEIGAFVPTATQPPFPKRDWGSFLENGRRTWFHKASADAVFADGNPASFKMPFDEGDYAEDVKVRNRAYVVAHAKAWLAAKMPTGLWRAACVLDMLEEFHVIRRIAALPDDGNPGLGFSEGRAWLALRDTPKEAILAARILADRLLAAGL